MSTGRGSVLRIAPFPQELSWTGITLPPAHLWPAVGFDRALLPAGKAANKVSHATSTVLYACQLTTARDPLHLQVAERSQARMHLGPGHPRQHGLSAAANPTRSPVLPGETHLAEVGGTCDR